MLARGSGRALAAAVGVHRLTAGGTIRLALLGSARPAAAAAGSVGRRWMSDKKSEASSTQAAPKSQSGIGSGAQSNLTTLNLPASKMQLNAVPFLLGSGWTRRGNAFLKGSLKLTIPSLQGGLNSSNPQQSLSLTGLSQEVNELAVKLNEQLASVANALNSKSIDPAALGEFYFRGIGTKAYQIEALFNRDSAADGKGLSFVGEAKQKFDVWVFQVSLDRIVFFSWTTLERRFGFLF